MIKNNNYTTGNLLDYDYFSKHYKLIAITLSKQIENENPDLKQKLILLVSLKKILEQQCFSSSKNQKKQLLIFYKILQVSYKMETQTIINLLNDSSNKESKLTTTKYVIDSQTAKDTYSQNNFIKLETESIKSILCDYSDTFVLVTGDNNNCRQ